MALVMYVCDLLAKKEKLMIVILVTQMSYC